MEKSKSQINNNQYTLWAMLTFYNFLDKIMFFLSSVSWERGCTVNSHQYSIRALVRVWSWEQSASQYLGPIYVNKTCFGL